MPAKSDYRTSNFQQRSEPSVRGRRGGQLPEQCSQYIAARLAHRRTYLVSTHTQHVAELECRAAGVGAAAARESHEHLKAKVRLLQL